MQLVELRVGEALPDLLRRCREEAMSARAIGDRLGVAPGTVQRWLVRFDLDDASLIQKGLHVDSANPTTRGPASAA
jgi:hypothetical protein